MIKKIGILTSGGDAPGMNAAVSASIRIAIANGIEPFIIRDGYAGLTAGLIEPATIEFADKITSFGGTAIGSARFPSFAVLITRKIAISKIQEREIEALIVIGGDGSYQGALKLTRMGINCIGLPGTIDNDIASTDYTLGFDSCLNIIVDVIDSIRNTMNSHNRCGVIEVMGRGCGDLALFAAQATGVEIVSTSENKLTEKEIIDRVKACKSKNRRSVIVLVTELIYDIKSLAKAIEKETGYVSKDNVIGHVQRGGKPSAFDRRLGYELAKKAVSELIKGNGGKCIGIIDNKVQSMDIEKALKLKRPSRTLELKELTKIQKSFI